MTKPAPFSFSSFSDFVSCPRKFFETRILKRWKEDQDGEHLVWGREVHKAFEDRQRDGIGPDGKPVSPLPDNLAQHEPYMRRLDAIPGKLFVEQRVALNTKLEPCAFFAEDCFYRGVIDWIKVDLNATPEYGRATIVDYKTGKVNEKWRQLILNALWVFQRFGETKNVRIADCRFYWTKEPEHRSQKVYGYGERDLLWKGIIPDLKQYKEAFKLDAWQPRKSGLCKGWCPVKDCENWSPRRK